MFFSSGLCTILRPEAGGQHLFTKTRGSNQDDEVEDDENYMNNAHWLPELLEERALRRSQAREMEQQQQQQQQPANPYGPSSPEELPDFGDIERDEHLREPGQSNFVQYYDATSLYPSSGEYPSRLFFAPHTHTSILNHLSTCSRPPPLTPSPPNPSLTPSTDRGSRVEPRPHARGVGDG